jgi:acyl-CoA hydrolase
MRFPRFSHCPRQWLRTISHTTLPGPKVWATADEAVAAGISNNARIYVHGTAATPRTLLRALAQHATAHDLSLELTHLHLEGSNPCTADQPAADHFFTNNLFIGSGERARVAAGKGSMIPVFLSDIPKLIRSGVYRPQVGLFNVSPPDKHGFCSLGVEVCAALPAWECADVRIAQINPRMPRTHGTSFVPFAEFHHVVDTPLEDQPLPQQACAPVGEVDARIGKHIAGLIKDGSTLQVGIGVGAFCAEFTRRVVSRRTSSLRTYTAATDYPDCCVVCIDQPQESRHSHGDVQHCNFALAQEWGRQQHGKTRVSLSQRDGLHRGDRRAVQLCGR